MMYASLNHETFISMLLVRLIVLFVAILFAGFEGMMSCVCKRSFQPQGSVDGNGDVVVVLWLLCCGCSVVVDDVVVVTSCHTNRYEHAID